VPNVGGAYVALNDAANDRNVGTAGNPSSQALLQTARQLEGQARTPIEHLNVQSARLGLAQTGFTQRNVQAGSAEGDALLGAMGEAAVNGLPGEGNQGVGPRPTQSGLAGATGSELPRTTGNRVNSPARVTAEAEVNGEVFRDTNPAHRPPVAADTSEPTLIADRALTRDVQRGQPTPNANMADAHAEIGAIQQAYAAGRTTGANMTLTVEGKAVCGFCMGDIAAMAERAGLNSLTVKAFDRDGNPITYYWRPGMRTLKSEEKP
jgi:hypothetical protein